MVTVGGSDPQLMHPRLSRDVVRCCRNHVCDSTNNIKQLGTIFQDQKLTPDVDLVCTGISKAGNCWIMRDTDHETIVYDLLSTNKKSIVTCNPSTLTKAPKAGFETQYGLCKQPELCFRMIPVAEPDAILTPSVQRVSKHMRTCCALCDGSDIQASLRTIMIGACQKEGSPRTILPSTRSANGPYTNDERTGIKSTCLM